MEKFKHLNVSLTRLVSLHTNLWSEDSPLELNYYSKQSVLPTALFGHSTDALEQPIEQNIPLY